MKRDSTKRMMVEAVRTQLKRAQHNLTTEMCMRASCQTSWSKQESLAQEVSAITWTDEDIAHRDKALAGYEAKVKDLQKEVEQWEEALSHALDSLEGRMDL